MPGKTPCSLQGPWQEDYQSPRWSNDYHFNVNVQQVYTLALPTGRFEHMLPLFDMLESEAAQRTMRENARFLFGIEDGLLLTHAVDDRCMQVGGCAAGSMLDFVCGGWMAMLYWLYYRYTGDREFLRHRAMPFMRGVMNVFRAAMREDSDGKLMIPLAISAEYGCTFPVICNGKPCHQNAGKNPSNQLTCCHALANALTAGAAAKAAGLSTETLCSRVYTLVIKRLYCSLVRILLHTEQNFFRDQVPDSQITRLIEQSFEDAVAGRENMFSCAFSTRAVLIGIGAPTHLFLKQVARMLHTRAVIPEHASVANAVGAIVGNVCTSTSVQILPDSRMAENFQVVTRDETRVFPEFDDARAYAREKAGDLAVEALENQGGKPPFAVTFSSRRQEAPVEGGMVFLSETVTADAAGKAF